jgi:ribosomal protein S17E
MNFRILEKYAQETSALIDENAEALMGVPLTDSQRKTVRNAIAVLGDLDSLTSHSRREAGVLRSSVHFKTR